MSTEDAKAYLSNREVPRLFECLMTGLMFHRPNDHIQYLIESLEKVKRKGQAEMTWNMFVEVRSAKTPLPPITPDNGKRPVSRGRVTPKEESRPITPACKPAPLPPIGSSGLPNVPVVFIMGGPGCGKKEQSNRLAEKHPGWVNIHLGDLLRNEVSTKEADDKWRLAKEMVYNGELAPEELTLNLIFDHMKENMEANGYIIEGFPRDMEQAQAFEKMVGRIDAVFLLDCEEDTLTNIVLTRGQTSGRLDDSPVILAKRLATYREKTLPVLKNYDDSGKLYIIGGEQDEESVHDELSIIFETLLQNLENGRIPTPPLNSKPSSGRRSRKGTPCQSGPPLTPSSPTEPDVVITMPTVVFVPPPELKVKDEGRKSDLPQAPIIFITGGPGCGKGTQCKNITGRYSDIVHLSMGDILRKEISDKGSADQKWAMITKLLQEGDMAPVDVTDELLLSSMKEHPDAKAFIVEGYPRDIVQYENFNQTIGGQSFTILLDCDDNYLRDRLILRGGGGTDRIDDNVPAIEKKLCFYASHTLPLMKLIDDEGKLIVVDGDRDEQEIFFDLVKCLDFSLYGLALEETKPAATATAAAAEINVPVIFVIGGPGSGKGTQSEKIVEKYGFTHLSSGDLLRAEVASKTERSKKLVQIMERGELVPLDAVLELLKEAMQAKAATSRGFLIDGYPRELEQGIRFEKEVAKASFVLFFDVTDKTMTERLLMRARTSNRVDDNEETIKKRLATFHGVTQPVIDHYTKEGKVQRIEAEKGADEIFAEVTKVFASKNIMPQKSSINVPVVFVVGGPGSGKGTQCDLIVKKYGYTHLSSGDLLRDEVASKSERGKALNAIMEKGELVTLDTVLLLLREAMEKRAADSKGFLIDGYPRELEQGLRFESQVRPASFVLSFDVSDDTMTKRLLGRAATSGRVDDNEETIIKRLKTFHDITQPVVDFYGKQGKLKSISAEGDKNSVFSEVEKIFDAAEATEKALKECKIVFIIGGPGSGKGTQCANIVKDYGFCHLSSGDLLRDEVKSGSERGQRLNAIMEKGDLVSLDEVLGLLRDAIVSNLSKTKCFLIDGYPRELEQGIRFESEVGRCDSVIYFDVSDSTMTSRLLERGKSSGRVDDNVETIKKRLSTFHNQTKPVINHYDAKGIVKTITAEKDITEVYKSVKAFMDTKSW